MMDGSFTPVTAEITAAGISMAVPTAAPTVPPTAPPTGPPIAFPVAAPSRAPSCVAVCARAIPGVNAIAATAIAIRILMSSSTVVERVTNGSRHRAFRNQAREPSKFEYGNFRHVTHPSIRHGSAGSQTIPGDLSRRELVPAAFRPDRRRMIANNENFRRTDGRIESQSGDGRKHVVPELDHAAHRRRTEFRLRRRANRNLQAHLRAKPECAC